MILIQTSSNLIVKFGDCYFFLICHWIIHSKDFFRNAWAEINPLKKQVKWLWVSH